MIPLLLSDIANITQGKLIGVDATITNISTDSRTLAKDDVFLALKGDTFDGHKFSQQAEKALCKALIVEQQQVVSIAQVVVKDSLKALGQIGAYVKAQVAPKTVGITGSSGKTTVKEMTAAILSRLGNVLATKGNFNNDIGVPLTLLRLTPEHDYAVIEMGANHIGEISYTSNLVKPDVAVINNIAAAHLEGFGDLCGVARAKGEIFEGLSENGIALYNKDCKYANKWQWRLVDKNVRQFSCLNTSDCYSSDVVLNEDGCASFKLNTYHGNTFIELTVPGKHNVCNAVAAAAIALEFGASLDDIRLGLAQMKPVQGRMNLHHVDDKFKVIDDTYNANVESIKAAIELLASFPGRRVLVLGDMAELGAEARSYHQEVGEFAKALGIDDLLTLGVLSQATSDAFAQNNQHFSDKTKLVENLTTILADEAKQISVLVKGSRSSKMELVVQDILTWRASLTQQELV
ncbi:MAG: UDP-N-acetylmuramoyl-tripeptide--D-alanyl-D-alanine ligase [Thalassotalea sp.]